MGAAHVCHGARRATVFAEDGFVVFTGRKHVEEAFHDATRPLYSGDRPTIDVDQRATDARRADLEQV